jgi:hypothetical protein
MSLASLWLPVVLSAVVVWVASAIVWMALWHKTDFKGLSDEESVRGALKSSNPAPGQYWMPFADQQGMKDPDVIRRFEEGPVAILTVMKPGRPGMGKNMGLALLYYLFVGIFVAYVASRYLPVGGDYMSVFRLTSVAAFMGYGIASIPDSIWFGRPWNFTMKLLMDALIYGLLTGGVFGWLWPS